MRDKCGVVGICLQPEDDASPQTLLAIDINSDNSFINNSATHSDNSCVADATDSETSVAWSIYYALYSLQHRGQESCGIVVNDGNNTHSIKKMGLVPDAFSEKDLAGLKGHVGIGHVRYSTSGSSRIENCQPFITRFKNSSLAIAHNGNLLNSEKLRREMEDKGRIFLTDSADSDTDVIAHLLADQLLNHDPDQAIIEVIKQIRGSYSVTILIDDTLYAVRDPLGLKPLCIGKIDGGYIVASESVAIDALNGVLVRDVHPGEIISIKDGVLESNHVFKEKHSAHCVFEYIYFARADSIIDGKLVYDVRRKIGERLAREHPADADIVSPVPDSGITAAVGFAAESGTEYREGLMKNRYVGRTFIMPDSKMRDKAVRLKMNTIKKNIDGKSIVVVDDSVVRGTTSRRIITMLRNAGAAKIHMRVAAPPIIAPCYLGIDMATRDELIAPNRSNNEINTAIQSDSLGYISIEGLIESVGIPREDLCLGCLTSIYPLDIEGEKSDNRQTTLQNFDK